MPLITLCLNVSIYKSTVFGAVVKIRKDSECKVHGTEGVLRMTFLVVYLWWLMIHPSSQKTLFLSISPDCWKPLPEHLPSGGDKLESRATCIGLVQIPQTLRYLASRACQSHRNKQHPGFNHCQNTFAPTLLFHSPTRILGGSQARD